MLPVSVSNSMTAIVPDSALLREVVEVFRPDLTQYADFYRDVHKHPELAAMEKETAGKVVAHLTRVGFTVHSGIGGHGVVGVFHNGVGKTILMRAELDALPILEQTDLPYRSQQRMRDRYENLRPTMHACGHDMNMAALLAAAHLLKAASHRWKGTILVVFQPEEEELTGAMAMLNGGFYDLVPVPDIMLAQHLVPARAGTVAIRSGPVLVAADTMRIRVIGGPCEDSINPQFCVDPILLATRIVSELQDAVTVVVGPDEDATVACWGFHAGVPGNDYVAYADILLDIKTVKPDIRQRVLGLVTKLFLDQCRAAGVPRDPETNHSVRAPLTSNHESIVNPIDRVFRDYFTSNMADMALVRSTEDFRSLVLPTTYHMHIGILGALPWMRKSHYRQTTLHSSHLRLILP
jgi:amidohydrolase